MGKRFLGMKGNWKGWGGGRSAGPVSAAKVTVHMCIAPVVSEDTVSLEWSIPAGF